MRPSPAPMPSKPKIAIVSREEEGLSLQDFLANRLHVTKRAAKAMLDARVVWVNRKLVWIARHALRPGDKVAFVVRTGTGARQDKSAERRPHIRVLWQDDAYLAVDKPAGVLTQGRGLGIAAIVASQDYAGILEADKKGAQQMVANTSIKIFMKMQDAEKTWELIRGQAGQGTVLRTTGFNVNARRPARLAGTDRRRSPFHLQRANRPGHHVLCQPSPEKSAAARSPACAALPGESL